jgi:UDP-3-O-[3-hydroxymyristoyl] N-acetylglucosamine deacetylase/3-hydroxyacyl-[acyl-carrier-protein] dehydratase
MKSQKTIERKSVVSGIGVHTGSKTTMVFHPAPPNTGIRFTRVDLPSRPSIKAGIESVIETARGTILGNGEAKVHTVEHVMAALWAFGITNIQIELDAEEPPVLDGSAQQFVDMLLDAGIREQGEPCFYYKVVEPITVTENDAFLSVLPYDGFKVSYTLDYDHPLVNTQYASFDLARDSFIRNISNCRTFCFYREVESLMDKGLIQGGSLDNAVVVGDEAILSKEGLRCENEFARHKILDLVGDLYLLGIRIEGHIVAIKSGHTLNVKLARLLKDRCTGSRIVQEPKKKKTVLNIEEIRKVLPHRYPFLLVDRIIDISEDGATGIKNVTANEDFFNGHFPGQSLMPGVLQIETMAQVAGVSFLYHNDIKNKMAILAGVEKAKFRRPVVPGDQLQIEVRFGRFKRSMGKASGIIRVNQEVVSEAELIFALLEVSP